MIEIERCLELLVPDFRDRDRVGRAILHAKFAAVALFRRIGNLASKILRHLDFDERVLNRRRLFEEMTQNLGQHRTWFFHGFTQPLTRTLIRSWRKAAGATYFQQKTTICSILKRARTVLISARRKSTNATFAT